MGYFAARADPLRRVSPAGHRYRSNRRLVVVELEIRQIGQVDGEIEREVPVGIPQEVEARPPFVKLAFQPHPCDSNLLSVMLYSDPQESDQKGVGEKLVLKRRLCRSCGAVHVGEPAGNGTADN